MIIIKDVSKSFGDKTVLKKVDLSINDGDCVCIMGDSGCGKTTLINILLGLEQPDEGTITGIPSKVSAVFQEDRLCEDFTSLSNVRMVLNTKDADSIAKNALIALGLEEALNKPIKKLSGGMKRRVAIARALVTDSKLVIMDEPFKGLDEGTKQKVIEYIKKCIVNKTLILVTHDFEEAKSMHALIFKMSNHGCLQTI